MQLEPSLEGQNSPQQLPLPFVPTPGPQPFLSLQGPSPIAAACPDLDKQRLMGGSAGAAYHVLPQGRGVTVAAGGATLTCIAPALAGATGTAAVNVLTATQSSTGLAVNLAYSE